VDKYKFTTNEATEILSALPSADAKGRVISAEKLKRMKFVAIKGDKTEEAYRTGWNGAIDCVMGEYASADAEPSLKAIKRQIDEHWYLDTPSSEAVSDALIIKGAKGIKDGWYKIEDGNLYDYKDKGGTVRSYPIIPSAEAVQGVGRYENAMQKLREMPKYLNGVKAKQIKKIPSDAVQVPIKLEKRYPESKDEDITDAFMRGYLAGRSSAEAVQGETVQVKQGRKKIYIAGPVTGVEGYEETFAKAADDLRAKGYEPVNPVDPGLVEGFTYRDYINRGFQMLMDCDGILLLPGYEYSKGARLELVYAVTVEMEIIKG
jgi:hypothetical protein